MTQMSIFVCQTDYSIQSKLRIFLLFRSHAWKYNIQANKRLTKVKKENDNYSI